jgi:hypothetical protein
LKLGCWFWRRRFLKFFSVFLLFCDYLPLEKGKPLNFNNLESPPPKDDLCQVWLKFAKWFWRRSRKCKHYKMAANLKDKLSNKVEKGQAVTKKGRALSNEGRASIKGSMALRHSSLL